MRPRDLVTQLRRGAFATANTLPWIYITPILSRNENDSVDKLIPLICQRRLGRYYYIEYAGINNKYMSGSSPRRNEGGAIRAQRPETLMS